MASGEFKIGTVTTDINQLKVHRTQLSSSHIQNLQNVLKETISKFNLAYTNHLLKQIEVGKVGDEMGVITDTINDFLENSNIDLLIEYNEKFDDVGELDRRILLRSSSKKIVKIKDRGNVECNYCFVVNIDNANIVTAYWNEVSDNHCTLDLHSYDNPKNSVGLKKIGRLSKAVFQYSK